MNQQDFIRKISDEFSMAAAETKALASIEEKKILTEQPRRDSWSAAQCYEHLNQMMRLYHGKMEPLIERKAQSSPVGSQVSARHSVLGSLFLVGLKPGSKLKVPSPGEFLPEKNEASSIDDFLELQKKTQSLLEQASTVRMKKDKFPTPVTRLIRFNLVDGFQLIAWHNMRHIEQAKRAIKAASNG